MNVAIASKSNWLANPNYEVMYIDTDCLVMKQEINTYDKLGDFKLESIYKEVLIFGPKTYTGVRNNGEVFSKAKGYSIPINWEDFKN